MKPSQFTRSQNSGGGPSPESRHRIPRVLPRVFAVALVVALCLPVLQAQAAPETTSSSPSTTQGAAGFRFGIGDVITVSVWRNPELATTAAVRPDGMVNLPLVGEIEVQGKTPEELLQHLTARYGEFITAPAVSVLVPQIKSRKFYVLGQVTAAGVYDLLRPISVVQALAMAGGFSEFAQKDEIVVLRETPDGTKRIVVNYNAIVSGNRVEQNIQLQPGDTILVP